MEYGFKLNKGQEEAIGKVLEVWEKSPHLVAVYIKPLGSEDLFHIGNFKDMRESKDAVKDLEEHTLVLFEVLGTTRAYLREVINGKLVPLTIKAFNVEDRGTIVDFHGQYGLPASEWRTIRQEEKERESPSEE